MKMVRLTFEGLHQNTCNDDGVSTLTSPSSSFTCTVTPEGTLPGGYIAHLLNKHRNKGFETLVKDLQNYLMKKYIKGWGKAYIPSNLKQTETKKTCITTLTISTANIYKKGKTGFFYLYMDFKLRF